jgi:3-hydroxyisobutyrate dehydrogenase-like beta-hydroxyacid dehydrogenase
MAQVGFVGLGTMGAGMARRLVDAGHDVIVWNRSRASAEQLADAGARVADTAEDALRAGVAFSMLADDGAALNVFTEDMLQSAVGATHVNMATVSHTPKNVTGRLTALTFENLALRRAVHDVPGGPRSRRSTAGHRARRERDTSRRPPRQQNPRR